MGLIEGPSVHATRMVKILEIVWKFFNPLNAEGKLNNFFIFVIFTQVGLLIGIGSYVITTGLKNLTATELVEKAGYFLQVVRQFGYLTILLVFQKRIRSTIDKIAKERDQLRSIDDDWSLSIIYLRKEFRITVVSVVLVTLLAFLVSFFVFFVSDINEFQLIYGFYFVFLPFDNFMTPKWFIHYILQVIMADFSIAIWYIYSGYVLLLMNFSCWEIDALTLQVKKMYQQKKSEENLIEEQVKKTILRTNRVMDWMNEARAILRFSFLIEFSMSAFIFGMCFYTLSSDVFASIAMFVMVCLIFLQLCLFCWMGNRVNVCVENLTSAIYEVEWYTQKARNRKDVLLILIMAQRLEGFNGIFNSVDFETLLTVLQFTYSLLTLLQTTN